MTVTEEEAADKEKRRRGWRRTIGRRRWQQATDGKRRKDVKRKQKTEDMELQMKEIGEEGKDEDGEDEV